ncbi:MAG: hypothetical protein RLZZ612_1031 [Pseudomonadota bacterium]
MSRMPEASFVPSAPAASQSPSSASRMSVSLLYWVGVCVLALIGWAASTGLQVAHARDVYWSIGVNVPGGVVHARTEPPVVVYREPVPVYRPPVVVHRPPAYIMPAPPVAVVEYPRDPRWDERRHHRHHPHSHGYGYRYEGHRYPDPYAHRYPQSRHRGDW